MEEKEIRRLIARFLAGATTNAEERTLCDYFAGHDVAPGLAHYRPMFGWYAGGCREEQLPGSGLQSRQQAPAVQTPAGCSRSVRRRRAAVRPLAWALGLAASLLLLIGAGLGYGHYQARLQEYAAYEGSYIIRDGKKLTDIREILPELKVAEREVMELQKQKSMNQKIPTI